MNTDILQRHFARIGATLDVEVVPSASWPWRRGRADFVLDVIRDRQGEAFALTLFDDVLPGLDLQAVDLCPASRHLLLLARRSYPEAERPKEKFLCGHDERHWFVATVPDVPGITRIDAAMEALKPAAVLRSQRRNRVKQRHRHRRRNAGFIRQGEWFFVPAPRFVPPHPHLILRNEPIRRGSGKPHSVEEVYRVGGETVYVSRAYPQGLREQAYRILLQRDRQAARLDWRSMRRNPTVYARGKVRHADHKTVVLPGWHQVALNAEHTGPNVAFLD